MVPDIDAHCQVQERTFVRQVGPVASVLASLDMVPFRLRFSGTAGSGKSLVARHFFARMAAEGKRVLLTCFNRPLAMRIRARVPAAGYVDTFHGFCVEFLKHCGQAPRFDRAGGDPDFWRRIPDLVAAERIPNAWRFDALVVDEGQDFEQDWFDVLTLFLREGADILWLEDADQNLQGKPPVKTVGFVAYRCTFNYRSPESIARVIRNTLPFEFDLGNDLPGLGVGVHGYDDAPAQPKIVARVLQDLLRRGFAHEDIVVLSCRGAGNSVFSNLETVGGVGLRRFLGAYDVEGNQVLTQGKLTFDSIYHTGDTDVFEDIKLIPMFQHVDLMLACIGGHFTMDPARAALAVDWVGPAHAIPMHFGTFGLLAGTPEQFREALAKYNKADRLIVMKPGEDRAF